ncbi:hypothetical protein ES288_A06G135700v1 [Gossypium darwinii]|uniref:Uncharacterized protein n=1 Tax=Gossypium darwinii TaxID=34276 RepID=A0A5D2G6C7_GOSDA|nr:hypothetical protein ES288_A06G135700v1 [Gossypium darwinii]TYH13382.1 hypothetical protein ES288_A06G135700v1 [Gossypium darwinii]TYH13383.1 hypothetical protein ES288_A06G135700v1 [Gossypium darwinii]
MANRSLVSLYKYLYKYLFRHPFQSSAKPTSPFLFKSLSPLQTQLVANSVPSPRSASFRFPVFQTSQVQHPIYHILRKYSSESPASKLDVNKEVDSINLKFAEAREEIEMAMESKETVYFNEEAECARASVKEVLDMFEGLLGKLPEAEKAALQRSMGLKIEQLKAELQQLDD